MVVIINIFTFAHNHRIRKEAVVCQKKVHLNTR
jgi:hypothetical protein